MSSQERPAATRCECGHPKSCHTRSLGPSHLDSKSGCIATVYEMVPLGMNAWPCPCSKFKEADSDA